MLLNRERDLSAQSSSQASDSQPSPSVVIASHSQGKEDPHMSFYTPPTIIDPSAEAITIIPGYQVTLREAGLMFRLYTSDLVPQFPFVSLLNDNACDLYRSKPLLFRTALWTWMPPSRDLGMTFERWFRQHGAYRVVVLLVKDLEILLSLLDYFAWYCLHSALALCPSHPPTFPTRLHTNRNDVLFYAKPSDTSLMQLARGPAEDLGLP